MKINALIEKKTGEAILFFPDDKNGVSIGCYAHIGQHSEASRAYMRSCKTPENEAELQKVYALLIEWARL